jgi:hypothetical protein
MKRLHLLIFSFIVPAAFLYGQEKPIDIFHTDAKGLSPARLQEYRRLQEAFFNQQLQKPGGLTSEKRSLIIQGNKIKTIIYNYSSISSPTAIANVQDLVWNGLGYGYEFGPLVGAKVPKANSTVDSVKIVSEGFVSSTDGEYAPGNTEKWGWLPKAGYAAPNQAAIASWGARAQVNGDLRLRPPSWPESWYNASLGQYVYPSYLGGNSTVPDEEVYFVVDDYTKKEFEYYPFPNDSSKRGLGVNLECRAFQFANPLAEDIIFLVYTVENSSPKILPKVYFGMFGDPHVGGASNYSDDAASFIPAREGTIFKDNVDLTYVNGVLTSTRSRNLVYAWDPDKKSDITSIPPGYFGYKFLESPNNSTDGIDNDDDGIIDESPFNDKGTFIDGSTIPFTTGISNLTRYRAMYGEPKARWSGDENGNWDPTRDDVGIDGIPNTGDFGEGTGWPDQVIAPDGTWMGSEPNFGFRDVNESDQIGLKSFWALIFAGAGNRPKDDASMYDRISSELDTAGIALLYPPTQGDNIFLYGTGPFELHTGDRQRFSIGLLMGIDLSDLLLNSETAQIVLEGNYRFAQPPPKPQVTAIPGDGKVTLYWDTRAEESIDPATNENDFEGYKIYRSEDYTFSDVFTITDGKGNPFLGKALYDDIGKRVAQWHKPWTDAQKVLYANGYHPAEYIGRSVKYWMGEPDDVSGLRHQFVDSSVTNGKTYYYAVVSFDHGFYSEGMKLPPTECQSTILRDPVTSEFKFDLNTARAVPGGMANGYNGTIDEIQSGSTVQHLNGPGTGAIRLKVFDGLAMGNNSYSVSFKKIKSGNDSVVSYSILRSTPLTEVITGRDTLNASLTNRNIVKSSVTVTDMNNTPISATLTIIDSANGQIKGATGNVLRKGEKYNISYQYYPVVNSPYIASQDANPVFDGIRPFIVDDKLEIDTLKSGFITTKPSGIAIVSTTSSVGVEKLAPLDIQVSFTSARGDTNAIGMYTNPADSLKPTSGSLYVKTPFKISNATVGDTTTLTILVKETATGKAGRWDYGEELVILTPPPYKVVSNNTMLGILIKDTTQFGTASIPSGTKYVARMKKPFSAKDKFAFTSKSMSYNEKQAANELDKIIVVPNPYVAASTFEQPVNRPDLRGDRVIQFRNLPRECTIRIYTITGELVQTLRKNDSTNYLSWDVLSSESSRLGYGVYIYHVETPAGGSKIGRLALIK